MILHRKGDNFLASSEVYAMGKYMMRFVRETDAPDILEIYDPYIKETAITFECETPSIDEFKNRIREISADYPYLVCLGDGKIVGYAYAHRHMERAAYQWNAELSVYVSKEYHRCGIGKAFYSALIDILALQNIQNVYGGVSAPNLNSEKLHEYLGFQKLGTYHHTGYKYGTWHDVMWFEKTIDRLKHDLKPFLSIQRLNEDSLNEILRRYSDMINRKQTKSL